MNKRDAQELSNAVMAYLAIKNVLHYKVRNGGTIFTRPGGGIGYGRDKYWRTQRGAPDILAWDNGKAYAFELKSAKGKTSPEQEDWLSRFRDEGGIGMVVRSLDEVMAVL